jgi:hypothetical protein
MSALAHPLTILQTTDVHGTIGLLPWLGTLLAWERACSPQALALDAGDAALGETPPPLGAALVAALRYDALTPSNAENDLARHQSTLAATGRPLLVAKARHPRAVPVLQRTVGTRRAALLGLQSPARMVG